MNGNPLTSTMQFCAVAIAFRNPTCTGGQATKLSLSAVGLVDEVAYQIVVTVSRHIDMMAVFAGDLYRVDDLIWESTMPPLPDGTYELQVCHASM